LSLSTSGSGQIVATGPFTATGSINSGAGASFNGNLVLNNNSGSGPQTIYGATAGNPGQNLYLDSTMSATKASPRATGAIREEAGLRAIDAAAPSGAKFRDEARSL